MIAIEQLLFGIAILLLISVASSKASGRLGVPALLVFLVIGMLAGSDGPGGIHFENYWQTQSLGVVALALILFAGGVDAVKPIWGKAMILATLGVVVTAGLVGWFAHAALGFSVLEGLLLGAIISSTDAAAVFAVLRSKSVSLKGDTKPLIELESGSNDPMAVFLTIALIRLMTEPNASVIDLIPAFFLQMLIGALAGYLFGRLSVILLNRIQLEYEGLYPVLSLGLVLMTYGATTLLSGNGFLAVYVAGLVMGNMSFIHKKSLIRFHDGLAWLMQIAMFVTLGLLVFPSQLPMVVGAGLLVSAFLILVARPLSVFSTMAFTNLSIREKTMISWVGLRGSVPIVLATFPLVAGIPKADLIFNLVFFIVLTSVLLQGTTIPVVAKWLKLDAPIPQKVDYPLEFNPVGNLSNVLAEQPVPPGSWTVGKAIVDLNLPVGALIVLLSRRGEFIVPTGGTILEASDTMLLFADTHLLADVKAIVEASVIPDARQAKRRAVSNPAVEEA